MCIRVQHFLMIVPLVKVESRNEKVHSTECAILGKGDANGPTTICTQLPHLKET